MHALETKNPVRFLLYCVLCYIRCACFNLCIQWHKYVPHVFWRNVMKNIGSKSIEVLRNAVWSSSQSISEEIITFWDSLLWRTSSKGWWQFLVTYLCHEMPLRSRFRGHEFIFIHRRQICHINNNYHPEEQFSVDGPEHGGNLRIKQDLCCSRGECVPV